MDRQWSNMSPPVLVGPFQFDLVSVIAYLSQKFHEAI